MRIVVSSMLFFLFSSAMAQRFSAGVSYKYMFADQWDKAIQTYNFSRPFIAEKQPLLMHGINVSGSYLYGASDNLKHGFNLSYSNFKSAAENENFNTILNLHIVNLGYLFHHDHNKNFKGLYTDIIVSAALSGLFRKMNDAPFVYDDTRSKALGIGGDLSVRAGYYLKLKNKVIVSPFLLAGYTPFLYSPNSEAVINQTKGLVSNTWTGIFSMQGGLAIHL